ncbi:MAG TPA: alcohol dehydrogenase catalytic domain-containing protein [Acidimicrobiales bacterium]|nr:alcohol dehydrogenase catalytic domain-containing protein [Acidimicrobiales bacterium]
MKAARFDGDGVVSFEERPDPVVGPGDAVVEVAYCGFCGSDKRLLRHGARHVPGHEIVGRVVALGSGPASVTIGQVVVVYALLHCGTCLWCTRGEPNRCAAMAGVIGWQADGGFAERVRVPMRNLLPAPPDVPLRRSVLALDTLGTASHGLRRAARAMDHPEGPTLVLGCGPLGLGVVAVARHRDMEVFAYDPLPARLEAAASLGARPWNAESLRVGGTRTPGPFALVVEATGVTEAQVAASAAAGQGGVVLMLGEGEQPWSLPTSVHWRRTEVAWVRSFYFPLGEAAANWQLVREVGGTLEDLLVSCEPFSELPRVSSAFLSGALMKPVVDLAAR